MNGYQTIRTYQLQMLPYWPSFNFPKKIIKLFIEIRFVLQLVYLQCQNNVCVFCGCFYTMKIVVSVINRSTLYYVSVQLLQWFSC